jgi:hypothetical protein
MSLFNSIFGFWNAPSAAELARQVAQRSVALACELVGQRTSAMGRAEARGYVRTKAAPVIRAEIAAMVARHRRLNDHALAVVYSQASERVVKAVLADLARGRLRPSDTRRAA